MQNNKYLYLWLGLVLMVFSGIKFYSQPMPPNSERMLNVYNYLHGGGNKAVSRSDWLNNYYQFDAAVQDENFFYILHYVRFTDKNTVFHFTVKPSTVIQSHDKNGNVLGIHNDPFPDPVIEIVYNGYLAGKYPLLRKKIGILSGMLTADLYFPLINRSDSEIKFWHNHSKNSTNYRPLFNIARPGYAPEIRGSTVWGIVFLLGLILFIIGISSNPIKAMRKVLVKEVNAIDKEKNKSLGRILGWSNSYKALSEKDQNRYSSTSSFYAEIQSSTADLYKYFPFKRTNSFEQGFQLFLLLSLVLLSSVMIFFCFKLILDPNASIDHLFDTHVLYSNFPLERRIADLEIAKLNLNKGLAGFMLFGIVSIVANYLLGAWRVKQLAKHVVGLRLMEYEKTLSAQIKTKTKSTNARISAIAKKHAGLEENHDSRLLEAASLHSLEKLELGFSAHSRLKEMKKVFKKYIKAFKRELKSHLKREKGRNAEN